MNQWRPTGQPRTTRGRRPGGRRTTERTAPDAAATETIQEEVTGVSQPEPADGQWDEEPPFPADPSAGTVPGARPPVAFRRRGEGGGGRNGDRDARDGRDADPGPAFERVPPQDLDAEQSVLGGMLLSKDAIADVVEVIKGSDFYRPAHETIYTAILDLYARGEPADPITVAAELVKRGELARIGGAPYLHTLVNAVPTAANAAFYAEIVHERAVLRRLVEAGTRITQMGYAADGDVDEIVNSAQAEIYAVTEQRTSEDYLPLADIMEGALDEIEAIGSRSGQMSGVPTGFADLDSLTNGLHPGQMIVIAARPAMGKSTLALDFARACSITNGMPSVIFSLEMGRNEIAMRLLSAEARVALHHMRSGSMTDDDWTRLARRMPDVQAAPLYIDDSPNLSMMEIRAKCRRLKQRNDLRLVVIDYLQLMQSGGSRRPESRQQEVSDMSRNLKLLAKELEVPVIALSQLNRGPEQRTDKKPMVSDLRESGCVTAATRVLRADTGAETTIGGLLASGARDVPVWSLDDRLRLVRRTMTHVFTSGVKPVFRLRLASGREIEATASHPFLGYGGWAPLGSLAAGDRVAVLRHPPGAGETAPAPASAPAAARLTATVAAGAALAPLAAAVRGAGLDLVATGDVLWDEVTAIEPLGEQPVYDATVPGTHNFVANGIHIHNSIEQDADMVILLHREDAYEKESPRAGEADLIVAKHRNGPTATITVAFQGHYSRFVDMAGGQP
jgi:replicative DNA helicase